MKKLNDEGIKAIKDSSHTFSIGSTATEWVGTVCTNKYTTYVYPNYVRVHKYHKLHELAIDRATYNDLVNEFKKHQPTEKELQKEKIKDIVFDYFDVFLSEVSEVKYVNMDKFVNKITEMLLDDDDE